MSRPPGNIDEAARASSWRRIWSAYHRPLGKSLHRKIAQNDSSGASFFHSMGPLSAITAGEQSADLECFERFVARVGNSFRSFHRFRPALHHWIYSLSHRDSS